LRRINELPGADKPSENYLKLGLSDVGMLGAIVGTGPLIDMTTHDMQAPPGAPSNSVQGLGT